MTPIDALPRLGLVAQQGHRLVNAKFPPIAIFDDVADQADFDALYAVQTLTNPRLQQQLGELNRVPPNRRPWGIPGCNYALGPFVHVNPGGSRFSNGEYGVFYCAENLMTAVAETRFHQQRYFQQVQGLHYDRIIMRALSTRFSASLVDITPALSYPQWHAPDSYQAAQQLGQQLRERDHHGLRYESVRKPGEHCYALLSPHLIEQIIPAGHYEYIWDGEKIAHVVGLA